MGIDTMFMLACIRKCGGHNSTGSCEIRAGIIDTSQDGANGVCRVAIRGSSILSNEIEAGEFGSSDSSG